MKVANNILELIGKTPLVKLNRLGKDCHATLYGKLEYFNPASSVKDRIALTMIEDAETQKKINKDTIIIEPTSGNTGVGLAMVCAVKGYRLILTMPANMSEERKKIVRGFGAEVVTTPAAEGMSGAIKKAEELASIHKPSFIPMQFDNPSNPLAHIKTTAEEIWNDTDGMVDIFVAGVGSGGTIAGVAEALKNKKKSIKIIAVEPKDSPVLSGGKPGIHKIQGIGAGFVPKVLDISKLDEIVEVCYIDAIETTKRLIKEEGIFCGISS
ncbi:MAG: cysteine synthase A, partial [Bacteroidales bacterium]|nr:cysteine synthase A [Bacteroidales bacterium]